MIHLKSKKAGEVYLSPWMMVIWVIIAGTLIMASTQFYSSIGDTRYSEADILATRLLDCAGNDFNYTKISANPETLYDKCLIIKNVLSTIDKYYVSLNAKDLVMGTKDEIFSAGDKSFRPMCDFQLGKLINGDAQEYTFAQCAFKNLTVYDGSLDKYYALSIITASNQN